MNNTQLRNSTFPSTSTMSVGRQQPQKQMQRNQVNYNNQPFYTNAAAQKQPMFQQTVQQTDYQEYEQNEHDYETNSVVNYTGEPTNDDDNDEYNVMQQPQMKNIQTSVNLRQRLVPTNNQHAIPQTQQQQGVMVIPPPPPPTPVGKTNTLAYLMNMMNAEKASGADSVNGENKDTEFLINPDLTLDTNKGCEILDSVRDDFEKFKSMNLIDENSKNELFAHSVYLVDPPAFAIKVETMYMSKYRDLIQKYNLEPFLRVWIVGLIFNKTDDFLKFINDSLSVTTDIIALNTKLFNFKVMKLNKRKRNKNGDVINTAKKSRSGPATTETIDNTEASASNSNTSNTADVSNKIKEETTISHPFDTVTTFCQKKEVFEIGKMYKYLIPSSFSMFFVQPKIGPIIKYSGGSGSGNIQHTGGDLKFSIPVLEQIHIRKTKFTHQDFILHPNYRKYIEAIYSKPVEWSSLSTRKETEYVQLDKIGNKTKNALDVCWLSFAIYNNSSIFVQVNNKLRFRTFPQSVLILDFQKWNAPQYNQEPNSEKIEVLKKYYESMNMQLIECSDDDDSGDESDDENQKKTNDNCNISETVVDKIL